MPFSTKNMRPAAAERLLLCIPRGGLNDSFCQIQLCMAYAKYYDRTLIIDTTKSGLLGAFDDFFTLASANQKIIYRLDEALRLKLDTLSCCPPYIEGRISSFHSAFYLPRHEYHDLRTGKPLTFDFDVDYPQSLLVHEQAGGGTLSLDLIENLILTPSVAKIILTRLSTLTQDYAAIHVRNTDYRTDYQRLFNDLYPKLSNKRVLICSDDPKVIGDARITFDQSTVFSMSKADTLQRFQNKPLHVYETYQNDLERHHATIDALTDLLALGGASELFYSRVITGQTSGFVTLALHLNTNKFVVRNMLALARTA